MSNSKEPDTYGMQKSVRDLLQSLNFNLTDANFKETPSRVAKMYKELLYGEFDLEKQEQDLFTTKFPSSYRGIVKLSGIKSISMCPHHLAPVFYETTVAYVPNSYMIGLSKLPRLTKLLSARAVMQETFTFDLAESLQDNLECDGCMVVVKGQHTCMSIRGVKDEAVTTTSEIRGIFKSDSELRQETLNV